MGDNKVLGHLQVIRTGYRKLAVCVREQKTVSYCQTRTHLLLSHKAGVFAEPAVLRNEDAQQHKADSGQ